VGVRIQNTKKREGGGAYLGRALPVVIPVIVVALLIPCRHPLLPSLLPIITCCCLLLPVVVALLVVVVGVAVVVVVVVVVVGSWVVAGLVVVVDQTKHTSCEWFGFVLDDTAWPVRPWVLHSLLFKIICGQMAEWLCVLLFLP
jgi:hypothetical protein